MLNGIMTRLAEVTADNTSNLDGFLSAIKNGLSGFSTTNLAKILLVGIGVAAPLFLAWFGYRFVKRKATSAVKKGTL